jgi:hypothetical protein
MKRSIVAPFAAAVVLFFGQSIFAAEHRRHLTDTRALVDQTLRDLHEATEFERHNGKQIERYENATRHLSDFDKEYTKGHFDKDKLDEAINDLKNVVEHNTLDPRARDALSEDLQDLRMMRADRR